MTTLARQPSLEEAVATFAASLPHTHGDYARRNWGHSLHSLCSYQGKLKPALAHFLVDRFVPPGGSVLDPLGGVGTVALEAALTGRRGISNDLSPFAAAVAKGKLDPPELAVADVLLSELDERIRSTVLGARDYEEAEFGLNASVRDYYHESTLREILAARRIFNSQSEWNPAWSFVWAALLHILHGNRPYALSRRSHPITPFSPTGPTEKKPLIPSLRAKVVRSLADPLPSTFRPGEGLAGDFRRLCGDDLGRVDSVITSPPFLGMRFDRPNWLRLWFCGWSADTFHGTLDAGHLERQQAKNRDCYREFFEVCSRCLEPTGTLVLHVGSGSRGDLAKDLIRTSADWFSLEGHVAEDVSKLEKHGIPDKRLTRQHHLLFFTPL